jgi:hypothetical protein
MGSDCVAVATSANSTNYMQILPYILYVKKITQSILMLLRGQLVSGNKRAAVDRCSYLDQRADRSGIVCR